MAMENRKQKPQISQKRFYAFGWCDTCWVYVQVNTVSCPCRFRRPLYEAFVLDQDWGRQPSGVQSHFCQTANDFLSSFHIFEWVWRTPKWITWQVWKNVIESSQEEFLKICLYSISFKLAPWWTIQIYDIFWSKCQHVMSGCVHVASKIKKTLTTKHQKVLRNARKWGEKN